MKVGFGDSFTKSLKRLIMHQTWWYKTYDAISYDIPNFIKNIWRFRKELYNHRWWDYRFTLEMLYRSISIMEKDMSTKGLEVRESRDPKVKQMRRAIELLQHNMDDDYIERAESEIGKLIMHDWEWEETRETSDNPMGEKNEKLYALIDRDTLEEKEHNRKVFERAKDIEDIEWNELWDIFKGTKNSKSYGEKYDGTDLRGWWD